LVVRYRSTEQSLSTKKKRVEPVQDLPAGYYDSKRDGGTGISLGPSENSQVAPNGIFLKIYRPLSEPPVPPRVQEEREKRRIFDEEQRKSVSERQASEEGT